ncbi:MAG: hypothetical protein ACRDZ1_04410 [Acidimicrobiia bacterium]
MSGGKQLARVEEMERALAEVTRGPEVEDPERVSAEIMERILRAETPAEVLGGQAVVSARDLVGIPHTITGVHFLQSDYDGGPGVYAIVDAEVPNPSTGEVQRLAYSSGSRQVLAQAFRLSELGAFPVSVRLVESVKPTAQGFVPMWLQAAE